MKRVLMLMALAGIATPAHAELVFFTTGRVMSVKGHRSDGSTIVLIPRDGGEITMSSSLVARIEPDEVPYPTDAAANDLDAQAIDGADGITSPLTAYDEIIN